MGEGDTLINAVVGAVITVVSTSVLGPLGPVLGGLVAGYLQRRDGPRIGAFSGAIASIPLVLVFLFGFAFFLGLSPNISIAGVGLVAGFLVFVMTVLVSVVLGAVGGYIGGAIAQDLNN